jgi:hypothetical protein
MIESKHYSKWQGEVTRLAKLTKLLLTFIIISLCCLLPLQISTEAHTYMDQSVLLDSEYISQDIAVLKESYKPVLLFAINILLTTLIISSILFLRTRSRIFLTSVISILKHIYLLFPIKYQSRYLALLPSFNY